MQARRRVGAPTIPAYGEAPSRLHEDDAVYLTMQLLSDWLTSSQVAHQLTSAEPCRIPGFDKETAAERPVGTVTGSGTCGGVHRWGELFALRSRDLDTDGGTVRLTPSCRTVSAHPGRRSQRRVWTVNRTCISAWKESVRGHPGPPRFELGAWKDRKVTEFDPDVRPARGAGRS